MEKAGEKKETGFPEEVISDILVRLPSKDLARYRCVSTDWNTLITSPFFVKAYLRRSLEHRNDRLLFQNSRYTEQLLNQMLSGLHVLSGIANSDANVVSQLKMWDSNYPDLTNLDPPPAITDYFKNFRMVDSINGVICLYGVNQRTSTSGIWLWNPAIHDFFALPEPRYPISSSAAYCVGFGLNPLSGDFKVITITEHKRSFRVEIYSRKTNTWRELVGCFPEAFSSISNMGNQVIFEEHICWRPYSRIQPGFGNITAAILSFNVVTEEFHMTALADSIPRYETDCIAVMYGYLAIFARSNPGGELFEVWTLDEFGNAESWSKYADLDMDWENRQPRATYRPLGVGCVEEAIFSISYFADLNIPSPTYLITYDIEMGAFLNYSSVSLDSGLPGRMARYVESLTPVSRVATLEEGVSGISTFEEEEEEEV